MVPILDWGTGGFYIKKGTAWQDAVLDGSAPVVWSPAGSSWGGARSRTPTIYWLDGIVKLLRALAAVEQAQPGLSA